MSQPKERTDISIRRELAVLAACYLPEDFVDERDPFGELRMLAETAGAQVVGELVQRRDRPEASTYMGSGKLEELKNMCAALRANVVIFDHELSPKQIAAIEGILERKVLDRSELILDIFASRATTKLAKIAVELAQLEYTYPRLRAMWSHLERIVGAGNIGGVGTRGPGEQQLEIDRRLVQTRKTQLKRRLEDEYARKHREVETRNREHYTACLVGYTNAGKSTLFNALTDGGAYADDRLFATLMTRTRNWHVGMGEHALLSDTVGFIRNLPHHLIASFRATLEEATHADLLIQVLDVSDPNAEHQYETVVRTLDELVAERRAREGGGREPARLLVLNKVDALRDHTELAVWHQREPNAVVLSARDSKHEGRAELEAKVRALVAGELDEREFTIRLSDSKSVEFVERLGEVMDREYDNGVVRYRARIGERHLEKLRGAAGWVGR